MGKDALQLATLFLGILLIVAAVGVEYIKSNHNASKVLSTEFTQTFTATESGTFSRKMLKVDIEGAVERPGIYELPDDSRIQDVLITAGGMTAKASRMIVSKDINLAQRIFDGQKIYIPEVGFDSIPNSSNLSNSTNLTNRININTASESQLDTLSGVGPVTVAKIVGGRPYLSTAELLTRHLVGASVYEKIKDSITTN